MLFPFGETVYLLAYLGDSAEDDHGNPLDSWVDAPGVAIPDCAYAPGFGKSGRGGTSEPVEDNRNVVFTTPQLFCPPGTHITTKDRVVVRGLVFEVLGDPADWRHPMTGWGPGVVVDLERVTG